MKYKILTSKDFKTTAWSGGTTTELYLEPEGGSYAERDFTLRISSATVDADSSVFTSLPGVKRIIAPLDAPLTIKHGGEAVLELLPYELHSFDGGVQTTSQGRARDFNIMYREGRVEAGVLYSKNTKVHIENGCSLFIFSFKGSLLSLGKEEIELGQMTLLVSDSLSEDEDVSFTKGGPAIVFYRKNNSHLV